MNRPIPRQPSVPAVCWKCNAQNNFSESETKICRSCGTYLKNSRASNGARSGGFFPAKIFALLGALLLVLVVSGVYLLRTNLPVSEPLAATTDVSGGPLTEAKELPADSWHKKSYSSYLRKLPTAEEILRKNTEVVGQPVPVSAIRTLRLNGEADIVRGDCFTAACAERREAERKQALYQNMLPMEIQMAERARAGFAKGKPLATYSDNYEQNYGRPGAAEGIIHRDGRFMRRIKIYYPNQINKGVEQFESFDGQSGWQRTTTFENKRVLENESKPLDPEALAKIQTEIKSLWTESFARAAEFKLEGAVQINDRTAFMLTRKDADGKTKQFYFDAVTGYLLKLDDGKTAAYFADYQLCEGSKVPHLIYYRRAEEGGFHSWLRLRVFEWKLNEEYDDSVFKMPAEPAAAAPAAPK